MESYTRYKSNLKRSDSDIPDVIYERRVLKYLPPEYAYTDFSEMIEIFEQIDKDRKGYITKDELAEYFRGHLVPESNVDDPLYANRAMSLDKVREEFEAIDTDHYGFITRRSLENYVRKNKLDKDLVDKWFQWFEGDIKGIITMEDVCTVLGIPMRKEYAQKVERKRTLINQGIIPAPAEAQHMFAAPSTTPKSVLDGVEILHNSTVPQEMLNACVHLVKEKSDDTLQESDIAQILKEYMDLHYKKHWIVVVATSTIGAVAAHEQNMFIHFRYNNRLYLLYRIPNPSLL